jgi:hypothetical protein
MNGGRNGESPGTLAIVGGYTLPRDDGHHMQAPPEITLMKPQSMFMHNTIESIGERSQEDGSKS